MKLTYGQRLRAARKHKRLSQEKLAEISGVGQGTISKIERGDQDASAYDSVLAHYLEINALWLSKGEERFKPDWLGGTHIEPKADNVGQIAVTLEGVGGHFQGQINNNLAALIATSSPNTRSILETLAKADQDGYLTDQDLKLLESIIQRLTSPHPLRKREKPSYGKLLDEAQKNHSSE